MIVTTDLAELHQCQQILVYLTGLTWTRGELSDQFADEVRQAMDMDVGLLLAHEMIGTGGQQARGPSQSHAIADCMLIAC